MMINRSKRDCDRPAVAAFFAETIGPSWQWSPTSTTCRAPSTIGTIHSGSVACGYGISIWIKVWTLRKQQMLHRDKTTIAWHAFAPDSTWVDSSMRMVLNFIRASRGSPAPIHVQHMTSACAINSFSHLRRSVWNRCSSVDDREPCVHAWDNATLNG